MAHPPGRRAVLQVQFPDDLQLQYSRLILPDPLDPHTWRAVPHRHNAELPLTQAFWEDMVGGFNLDMDSILISVAQEDDGRHRFVRLSDVARVVLVPGETLTFVGEAEAKDLRDKVGAALLYARAHVSAPPAGRRSEPGVRQGVLGALSQLAGGGRSGGYDGGGYGTGDDLCPKVSIWASNYSVIPDLCEGRTQRLILCDEATLMRSLPEEKIFDYLSLIVNCHEAKLAPGKYQVGACSSSKPPEVICQAVHTWYSMETNTMNRVNDQIQASMWESLQSGTVAVHCLAGIHRAACIVACHYLWRHYALGHQHIPSDPGEIYRRLQAVRPAVSPAYQHVLQKYVDHLKKTYAS